ncbi:MAG: hypothetical protein FE834_01735, partial [Gammaproteobacteria bacterium]|nr:hypothetical protein [Gammaproteobacteria bacterium]
FIFSILTLSLNVSSANNHPGEFDKSSYLDINTEYNANTPKNAKRKDRKAEALLKEAGGIVYGAVGTTDSDNVDQLGNKIITGVKSKLKNKAISGTERYINDKANKFANQFGSGRTKITISDLSSDKIQYGLKTIQPLTKLDQDSNDLFFFQGQFTMGRNEGERRNTTNLGVGRRLLLEQGRSIAGINLFTDYEHSSKHQRLGLGLEYQRTNFSTHLNAYHALTDKKIIGKHYEEALSGYDIKFAGQAPYLPWAKLKGTYYYWDNKVSSNIKGNVLGIEIELMPSVSFEFGQENPNDMDKKTYGKLSVSFPFDNKRKFTNFSVDDNAFRASGLMSLNQLNFVERNNKIKIEKTKIKANSTGNSSNLIAGVYNAKTANAMCTIEDSQGKTYQGKTNEDGTFKLANLTNLAEGLVMMTCESGSYRDEATGKITQAPTLHAAINYDNTAELTLLATPLSEIAYQLAKASNDGIAATIAAKTTAVAIAFGLKDAKVIHTIPTDLNDKVADNNDSGKFGLILALIAQMGENAGKTPLETITALIADINADDATNLSIDGDATNNMVSIPEALDNLINNKGTNNIRSIAPLGGTSNIYYSLAAGNTGTAAAAIKKVFVTRAAVKTISLHNNTSNNKMPTVQSYTDAGIAGVTHNNLTLVNAKIALASKAGSNTAEKIQAIINEVLGAITTIAANATLTASIPNITIGNTTPSSTLTLQINNSKNNNLINSDFTVTMSHNGTPETLNLSEVTNHHDGTYTATISNTTAETVTITASINGTPIANTVNVVFVKSLDIKDQTLNIDENSTTNTEVGTLTTQGTPATFTITAGNDKNLFKINNQGQILVAKDELDYETAPANKKYTLTVQISKTGFPSKTANITITINDKAETETIISMVANATLTANIPSIIIGNTITLSTITLQIKDAEGNNLNNDNLTITMSHNGTPETLNLSEVTNHHDGTYTATISNTTAETVTITASINGTPVANTVNVVFVKSLDIKDQTLNIDENSAINTEVGTLTTQGTPATFTITAGNDKNLFKINNQGQILVAKNDLDYETAPANKKYTLTVKISKTGFESKSANITIAINNKEELVGFAQTTSNTMDANNPNAAKIRVTLNEKNSQDVTVTYQASNSYTLDIKFVTIPAGDLEAAINIEVNRQHSEDIIITLSNAVNAHLIQSKSIHTYTPVNNNIDKPTVAFKLSASKGDESISDVKLSVTLDKVSDKNITVKYQIKGESTATKASAVTTLNTNANSSDSQHTTPDYTLLGNGTLTILKGKRSADIHITVKDDDIKEANETIIIALSEANGANLTTNKATTHTYTIINDDINTINPIIAFSDTAPTSGNEAISDVKLSVTLDQVSTQDITVKYQIKSESTATDTGASTTINANANTDDSQYTTPDYTLLGNGTLTILKGKRSADIHITVKDDNAKEANETIIIALSEAIGADLDTNKATHTYTIMNDDIDIIFNPIIAFSDTATNGDESVSEVKLSVTLDQVSTQDITVKYTIEDTSTATEYKNSDYTLLGNGTLTILKGKRSADIHITVKDDDLKEANETIIMTLSEANGADLDPNQATHTYTINDNDDFNVINDPTIAFSNTALSSGSESITAVDLAVVLSAASDTPVTVAYKISSLSTATGSGTDYTLINNGTLTINAGDTTGKINLSITNDTLFEENETIMLALFNPTAAHLGAKTTHTYHIIDNDTQPSVAFESTHSATHEGNTSTHTQTLVVKLNKISGKATTLDYTTTGTASSATSDYTLTDSSASSKSLIISNTSTLTIPANSLSATISINVIGDELNEPDESIIVTLSNPHNASLSNNANTHTHTIITDDFSPSNSTLVINGSANLADGTRGVLTSGGTTIDKSLTLVLQPKDYENRNLKLPSTATVTMLSTNANISFAAPMGNANNDGSYTATILNTSATATTLDIQAQIAGNNIANAVKVFFVEPISGSGLNNHEMNIFEDRKPDSTAYIDPSAILDLVHGITGNPSAYQILSGNSNNTFEIKTFKIGTKVVSEHTLFLTKPLDYKNTESYTLTIGISKDYAPSQERTVTFKVNTGVLAQSTMTVGTPQVIADGVSTSTITLKLIGKDHPHFGPIPSAIAMSATGSATLSPVVRHAGGTYEATLTNTASETVSISATIAGKAIHNKATVQFVPFIAFDTENAEGNQTLANPKLSVKLSSANTQAVTMNYKVTGTAKANTDYHLPDGTLTIPAGATSADIPLQIIDNARAGNRTVVITLFNPSTGVLDNNKKVFTYTIKNNHQIGFTIVQTPASSTPPSTTEAGGTATFTIVLNSEPVITNPRTVLLMQNAARTPVALIALKTSDTSEGKFANNRIQKNFAFTQANWNVPQSFTVLGQNDDEVDGNQQYQVTADGRIAQGFDYQDYPITPITLTNIDTTNPPSVTIENISGSEVSETGGEAKFSMVLNSKPTFETGAPRRNGKAVAAFFISSSDTTEAKVLHQGQQQETTALYFNADNWNVPQIFTVVGQEDQEIDGAQQFQITFDNAAPKSNYKDYKINPLYMNILDTTTLVAFEVNASGHHEDMVRVQGRGQVKVKVTGYRDEKPITVDYEIVGGTAQKGNDFSLPNGASKGTLTFNFHAATDAQFIPLTIKHDKIAENNETILIKLSNPSNAVIHPVASKQTHLYTIVNDDIADVKFSTGQVKLNIDNKSTATYTAVLTTQPTHEVTIRPYNSPRLAGSVASVATTTLSFNASNWNIPQSIKINKPMETGYGRIWHDITSSDPMYRDFPVDMVNVLVEGSVHFKGLVYGKVISPWTGKMWLDRNLGASRAATKVDDVLSYGDYYQGGRAADGHEKVGSTVVYFEDVRTISPGTSFFYSLYKPNPDDGSTGVDPNRWDWLGDGVDDSHALRSAAWKDGGVNDICPAGYSVPT